MIREKYIVYPKSSPPPPPRAFCGLSKLHKYPFGCDCMGKASQRKGRAGELELARILKSHGYDVHAGVSRSYGSEPDLTGLPGVHIECKRVERLNVPEAMAQAARDSERFHDGAPAVFHRRSREPWLVTMRLDDWLKLYGNE